MAATDFHTQQPVGGLLREWRVRRRLSQLELALEANTSPRHLSFIETGRSTPSREMLLRLAECLEVPLRERNDEELAFYSTTTEFGTPLDVTLAVEAFFPADERTAAARRGEKVPLSPARARFPLS